MANVLNYASWLGAPLLAALLLACASRNLRSLAIATLVLAVPLSLLLASNNNETNSVRNFFMGMLLFSLPLLFHAWMVATILRKQGGTDAI